MSQIVLDPIGYSEALQKAGMPKAQADLIARTEDARFDARLEKAAGDKGLATKADLALLEKRMAEMETRLAKSFQNALYGFAGILAALIIGTATLTIALLK